MAAHADTHGQAVLVADWPAPPGVVAFTTLRHGPGVSAAPFDRFNLGARCGDDPAAVATNRQALRAGLGLPSHPHWLQQVHGTAVLRVEAPLTAPRPPEQEPQADAAVTAVPGAVLAILTADCLPVVFAARDGTEVAIAHAGWQGLANGVLEATLAAMHTAPRELLAWIGPCAGPARYEVGRDVFDAFTAPDPDARAAFVPTREGHWRVDLPALARRRLAAAGMAPQAVHGGELCTISDPGRFFSHRRDRRSGRIATIAWIDPGAR